jgi:hypothetical protein
VQNKEEKVLLGFNFLESTINAVKILSFVDRGGVRYDKKNLAMPFLYFFQKEYPKRKILKKKPPTKQTKCISFNYNF